MRVVFCWTYQLCCCNSLETTPPSCTHPCSKNNLRVSIWNLRAREFWLAARVAALVWQHPQERNVSLNNYYQDEGMESITVFITNSTFLRTMSIYIIDHTNGPNQSVIYNMKKQKIHPTLWLHFFFPGDNTSHWYKAQKEFKKTNKQQTTILTLKGFYTGLSSLIRYS